MPKLMTAWTDERIADMAKWWEEGYSCAQIANKLGNTTRNAVIGKIHRLGLQGSTNRIVRAPKVAKVNKPRLRIVASNGNSNHFRIMQSVESDPLALRCVEVDPLHTLLLDLEPGACRYPYGEGPYTFCGHPAERSYCPAHARLVRVFTRPTLTHEQQLEKRREYTNAYRAAKRLQQVVFG